MKQQSWLAAFAVLACAGAQALVPIERSTWLVRFEAPGLVERAQQLGMPMQELRSAAKAAGQLKQAQAGAAAELLERAGQRLGRRLLPRFSYQYGFSGVALELSASEAAALRATPGVAAVQPDFVRRLHSDAGARWIGASQVWSGAAGVAGTRGAGVVIGVIDTGIAAGHPAFADRGLDNHDHVNPRGRRFGLCNSSAAARCSDKLIGIHDFTQEGARDGRDLDGHGTHVAAIAAGTPYAASVSGPTLQLPLQLSGVAPHASLISYKACTAQTGDDNQGSCSGSALVAALDQAIADGVDVINYSIGSDAADPWAQLAQASDERSMLNARAAGITVVVSAGNDGPLPGSLTSPANAPWVLAVANTTHDRVFRTELTGLQGAAPPRVSFIGQSLSGPLDGIFPIVLGEARGSALCGSGSDLDFPPTGASNPFAPGSLAGQIVVCDRGVQARVAKSNNVKLGGGAGMVLVNTELEGEGLVADEHHVPSVHLGFTSGSVLKDWLRATPDARGRITATASVSDPAAGDLLAASSGRGPGLGSGVLKPNLSAPGTSILAADFAGNGARPLSGTSMAAPHVAGAAALLKSAHPDWSAEQVVAALTLTAEAGLLRRDDGSPATALDGGAGRTQVQLALQAGLYLPLARADFERANPRSGGQPASLNLPELYSEACRSRCSFERTVSGLQAASWTVQAELPAGASLSVTPAQFSLAAGARQTLRFELDVSGGQAIGQAIRGRVLLRPTAAAGLATLALPVAVYSDPGTLPPAVTVPVAGERGSTALALSGLVALPGARYELLGPAPAVGRDLAIGADTDDSADAFASSLGTHTELVELDSSHSGLLALARASSGSADIDLYLGRDRNGDGLADAGEILCAERGPASSEQCARHGLAPGRYWIRLHNPGSVLRQARLDYAALGTGEAKVSGPARTAAGATLNLQLAYDLGGSAPGSRHLALLLPYAAFDATAPFANIALQLNRGLVEPADPALALLPGQAERLRLDPGATLERIYFDDLHGAAVLQVQREGSIEATLLDGGALPGDPAGSLAAPGAVLAQLAAGSPDTLLAPSQTQLQGMRGRYLVRLRNTGGLAASVTLQRQAGGLAASPQQLLALQVPLGMYYNPARPGHGLFLTRARDDLQVAWYTYDSNGHPTFYLGFATAAFSRDQLAPQLAIGLQRYTWDGSRAHGQEAGTAQLSLLGNGGFQWTWQLDQRSGSEPMSLLAAGACVEAGGRSLDLSGLWFDPAQPGFGASVFTRPDLEIQALYLYDGAGLPRWLWTDQSPFGSTRAPLFQYRGFCPDCGYIPASRTEVGSIERGYGPDLAAVSASVPPFGTWRIDTGFVDGLPPQRWLSAGATLRLTGAPICR